MDVDILFNRDNSDRLVRRASHFAMQKRVVKLIRLQVRWFVAKAAVFASFSGGHPACQEKTPSVPRMMLTKPFDNIMTSRHEAVGHASQGVGFMPPLDI